MESLHTSNATALAEGIDRSITRALHWLKGKQCPDGSWVGALRSNAVVWYAAGLRILGESADSPQVQDICEYVESCATTNGGIGAYPGEPASAYETSFSLPFLTWARPNAKVTLRAKTYQAQTKQRLQDPNLLLMRHVFQPELNPDLLKDKGPPNWLREAMLPLLKVHPSQRWKLDQFFAADTRMNIFDRAIAPLIMRALTFAPPSLDKAISTCISITGFDCMLLIYAAHCRLARDEKNAERLFRCAQSRRPRFIYEDGSHEWLVTMVAELFFSKTFALDEDFARCANAFRSISYEGNGWIRSRSLCINIFDTALTLNALKQVGGSFESEEMVSKAVRFLQDAQCPKSGMFSWAYHKDMGAKRRYLDTDDTGAACMALAGEQANENNLLLQRAAAGLASMQERSGAFSTFGDGAIRPNWCWLSNTSRSVQGMIAAGYSTENEQIQAALSWIARQQQPNGRWIDGWCARYIYGTVIALECLIRSDAHPYEAEIRRGLHWLASQQNEDGGWGESWSGERSASTPEHTGLAVYAICLGNSFVKADSNLVRSVDWIMRNQLVDGSFRANYFVNFGLNTGFADEQLPMVWCLHALGQFRTLQTQSQPREYACI